MSNTQTKAPYRPVDTIALKMHIYTSLRLFILQEGFPLKLNVAGVQR